MKLIHVLAITLTLLLCTSCTQPYSLPAALTTKRTVVSDTLPLTLAWQTRLDQIVVRAPIVLDNLVLLFTPEDLRALDVNSGTEQWRFKVEHGTLSMPLPVSHDNVIYIGSNAGLAALSLQDGTVLWKRPLQDGYKQNITAGITYSAGRVFAVSATSSDVLAFDAGNGMPLWRTETLDNMRGADLQVIDDYLYVYAGDKLHRFDARTGEKIDSLDVGIEFADAQHTPDRLYTNRGVFNARSLQPLVSFESPHDFDPSMPCEGYWLPHTLAPDGLFASNKCGVYRLNEEGKILWSYRGDEMPTDLVGDFGGKAYALLTNGAIVALDRDTGQEVGRMKTSPALLGHAEGELASRGLVSSDCNLVAVFNSYDVWGFTDPTSTACQSESQ